MKSARSAHRRVILSLALVLSLVSLHGIAEDRTPPTHPKQVYWGDTHVHTHMSVDAFALGTRLTSEEAYRFAKGEIVRAAGGVELRLRRPLDFLLVADHAENLGIMHHLATDHEAIPDSEASRQWKKVIAELPSLRSVLKAETFEEFSSQNAEASAAKAASLVDFGVGEDFHRSVWGEVSAAAERHNNPGIFTAFIGYEWSGRATNMVHRNVLFADGPERTNQVLPFSRNDSDNVEDLWAYMKDYEKRTGGQVLAIPHNGNLSNGGMFALTTFYGKPLTDEYARNRARWEPLYEVTQIKGDGETHPLLSPDDVFADFETWPPEVWSLAGANQGKDAGRVPLAKDTPKSVKETISPDTSAKERTSYARSALLLGLDQKAKLGTNPFKFGMIGSTDSHTALATADEDQFWGKMGLNQPSRYRSTDQWYFSGSGYAAVWATENTRASLFAALKRKETYATTGPRMTVRFFGGWNYEPEDIARTDFAQVAYEKGVPMGGDLFSAPEDRAPRFLIRAMKDPDGANLDRVQIIKGWRGDDGELHEVIYNVALSDERIVDQQGSAEPVGNTVDVANASYTNSIGDVELAVVWQDPDFDKDSHAFYYVRVLEIPTPRWTAYDAKEFALEDLPEQIPMVIQERAYTSPIWYTP